MKKLFIFIHGLLIFLIIDQGISAVYRQIAARFEIMDPGAALPHEKKQPPRQKRYNPLAFYSGVTERDLFKTQAIETAGPPEEKPEEKLEETGLNLELKGTVTGTGATPRAVIQKPGQTRDMLYSTGDTIDGALIKAVMRGRVILLVDGRKEVLLMKTKKANGGPSTPRPLPGPGFSAVPAGTADGFSEDRVLTIQEISALKANIKKLKKQVKVRPYYYQNKIQGFRVTSIKRGSVFHKKLGLRNGDVIAGVNNQAIQSVRDVARLYNGFKLKGNPAIDVKIKRHGKYGTLRYSIK